MKPLYIREFESLFVPIKIVDLKDKALNGKLKHCQFRSLCWRYFLKCLPENYDDWLSGCIKSREQYEKIKAKYQLDSKIVNPTENPNDKDGANVDNNASQSSTNQPQPTPTPTPESSSETPTLDLDDEQHYLQQDRLCDYKNLNNVIRRDVIRTFPDMDFFRGTEIQNILANVLFNYANENSHLSYKQGMHELLATLLYVLHNDSQNCLINYEGGYANETIAALLDLKYLEHDVFKIFCALMKTIESWYQNDEILEGSQDGKTRKIGQVNSVLGLKLNTISEKIVKRFDPELFNHLEALQIAPQIFGIRWMRLLFGREYEFLDLLVVWDALICDIESLALTDYLFASMLITIREELVNGDYTDCLNNLMRHQFKDINYVIKLALYLRDPHRNSLPQQLPSTIASQPRKVHYLQTNLANQLSRQTLRDSLTSNTRSYKFAEPNNFSLASSSSRNSHQDQRAKAREVSSSASSFDFRNYNNAAATNSSGNIRPKNNNKLSAPSVASFGFSLSNSSLSNSSSNKFLPKINKFVSSIGQNIQDMAASQQYSQSAPAERRTFVAPVAGDRRHHHNHHQQQAQPPAQVSIATLSSSVKEFEMREIQTAESVGGSSFRGSNRFPIGSVGVSSSSSMRRPSGFSSSVESYDNDDLHSIVDYCWRLLSDQIDSLQKHLPKEKGLNCEDEIFIALAQLKKVRDVLKGSLKLEDELDGILAPTSSSSLTAISNNKRLNDR